MIFNVILFGALLWSMMAICIKAYHSNWQFNLLQTAVLLCQAIAIAVVFILILMEKPILNIVMNFLKGF